MPAEQRKLLNAIVWIETPIAERPDFAELVKSYMPDRIFSPIGNRWSIWDSPRGPQRPLQRSKRPGTDPTSPDRMPSQSKRARASALASKDDDHAAEQPDSVSDQAESREEDPDNAEDEADDAEAESDNLATSLKPASQFPLRSGETTEEAAARYRLRQPHWVSLSK